MKLFNKIGFYKVVNVLMFLVSIIGATAIHFYLKLGYCIDVCSFELLRGFIKPAYHFLLGFGLINFFLIFFPGYIFRKWLLYVAPPLLLLTIYLIQDISVYSGNLLNPTRAKMAENMMIILALVTVVFVAINLFINWRKNKVSKIL